MRRVGNSFYVALKIVMVKDGMQQKDTIIVQFKLIRNQNKNVNGFSNLGNNTQIRKFTKCMTLNKNFQKV